ncbi:hypothetical protein Poli38472_000922 [Pythium oligandrum]|uniref:Uncharacterized protein n=1 Tax=Pythium oligandrum TaxID=41045 RepID=A0A8K1CD07_PYTOL|nr:hypothetical protein Poli38472_000922 [Pythium oligandrum]|eukprot:TMW60880.1 hypothetical protein Poli38472_000922 [Pythium oligandrum]
MVSGGGKRVKDRAAKGGKETPYPASRLLVWHSTFTHARSRHQRVVRGHAMNQQVEVVLPTRSGASIAQALRWETGFYYQVTTTPAMFLSKRFIAEYILQGAVYMIAKNVAIDSQNTVMLVPSGELLLLVDNETYEQLGLVGQKYGLDVPAECQSALQHRKRRSQRRLVRLDLKSPLFTTEASSHEYERLVRVLDTKFEPVEMLVCAYNERGAARTLIFGEDDTIERTRVELNGEHDTFQDVVLPLLDQFYQEASQSEGSRLDMEVMRSSLEGVYDWLGAVACRLTELLQQKPLEEYVSTFTGQPDAIPTAPEPQELSTVRWRGLIANEFVERAMDKARESVQNGTVPWAAVTVWGFPDAIVSWEQEYESASNKKNPAREVKSREHGYLLNGSNNYTFLLLPKDEYFVLQEVGPHDETM